MSASHLRSEGGFLATPVLFLVWCGLLVAIAVIDVGAYLVAAARAQGAADAAALAAVGTEIDPGDAGGGPARAATLVSQRNRATVESCRCRAGSGRAEVEVSVPVGGLFVPRVTGARRVTATARAELAAPAPPRAGPVPSPHPVPRPLVGGQGPG